MSALFRPAWGRAAATFSTLMDRAGREASAGLVAGRPVSGKVAGRFSAGGDPPGAVVGAPAPPASTSATTTTTTTTPIPTPQTQRRRSSSGCRVSAIGYTTSHSHSRLPDLAEARTYLTPVEHEP